MNPHLHKSTQQSREWWLRFSLKLQNRSITDRSGKVVNKRDVFESLYVESDRSDFNQPELCLAMVGLHPDFGLILRTDYNAVAHRNQRIREATEEMMQSIAVRIARNIGVSGDFYDTVSLMTKAMTEVYENYHKIDEEICAKVD